MIILYALAILWFSLPFILIYFLVFKDNYAKELTKEFLNEPWKAIYTMLLSISFYLGISMAFLGIEITISVFKYELPIFLMLLLISFALALSAVMYVIMNEKRK